MNMAPKGSCFTRKGNICRVGDRAKFPVMVVRNPDGQGKGPARIRPEAGITLNRPCFSLVFQFP